MTQETKRRDLARDTRDAPPGTVYEVMAEPDPNVAYSRYYLRPIGGGCERDVPPEYVEIVERREVAQ